MFYRYFCVLSLVTVQFIAGIITPVNMLYSFERKYNEELKLAPAGVSMLISMLSELKGNQLWERNAFGLLMANMKSQKDITIWNKHVNQLLSEAMKRRGTKEVGVSILGKDEYSNAIKRQGLTADDKGYFEAYMLPGCDFDLLKGGRYAVLFGIDKSDVVDGVYKGNDLQRFSVYGESDQVVLNSKDWISGRILDTEMPAEIRKIFRAYMEHQGTESFLLERTAENIWKFIVFLDAMVNESDADHIIDAFVKWDRGIAAESDSLTAAQINDAKYLALLNISSAL
ncbi:MAG: hypothetical protein ABII27_03485 [bacterium]